MSTEIFTQADFEKALTTEKQRESGKIVWKCLGLIGGELVYSLPTGREGISILIRSSVRSNGECRPSGEDSIRLWLVDSENSPLGSKIQKWITRLPGWQERLLDTATKLAKFAFKLKTCQECGKINRIFKVKKEGPNKGFFFQRCANSEHQNFEWIPVEK